MSELDSASVVDGLDVGIIVLDNQSRIVGWNDWIARVTGHSATSVLGKTFYHVFPGMRDTRLPAVIEDHFRSAARAS